MENTEPSRGVFVFFAVLSVIFFALWYAGYDTPITMVVPFGGR